MENMNNLEKEILDIAEQVEKELEAGGLTSGIYLNWLQEVCKRVVEIEMHRVRKQVNQEIEKAREGLADEVAREIGYGKLSGEEYYKTLNRVIKLISKLKDSK